MARVGRKRFFTTYFRISPRFAKTTYTTMTTYGKALPNAFLTYSAPVMSEIVQPPPPGENQEPAVSSGTLKKILTGTVGIVALAATEWLPSLLDQPTKPPFSYNAQFQNQFQRSARLIVFTLFISGVIVGGLNLYEQSIKVTDTVRDSLGL